VGGRAHDLEGDVLAGSIVAGQPDGGEVAPAQLAQTGELPFQRYHIGPKENSMSEWVRLHSTCRPCTPRRPGRDGSRPCSIAVLLVDCVVGLA
jgi:hypothetical protein